MDQIIGHKPIELVERLPMSTKSPRRKTLRWLSLAVLAGLSLTQFMACWGSRVIDIIVENQTDQVLTVFVLSSKPVGTIAPGQQTVQRGLPLDRGRYPIVARNLEGEVVFSETYTYMPDDKYHLIETNLRHKGAVAVYKAIIPPFTTNAGDSGGG